MTKRKIGSVVLTSLLATALLAGCSGAKPTAPNTQNNNTPAPAKEQVVNVYTARNYPVDKTLYDNFTKATGIKVNLAEDKAEVLIERIKREGESSPADLFITVDGGILNNAKQAGILQPITSKVIEENVPKNLRDTENQWIGLATRARVVAYSKERVKPEQLSTYEDLASPTWKGKLLVRSSTSLYNLSLLASLIELNGEAKAQEWATGVAENLARAPEGGDRDQIKGIAAGVGDVAITNTYYFAQMLNSADKAEVEAAQKTALFFPNQQTTGTHINISGAGLTKTSKNKENAVKLVEYLTSPEAQALIASVNYEFPVNAKTALPDVLKSWGTFKTQQLDFAKLGTNNKTAILLTQKANWK